MGFIITLVIFGFIAYLCWFYWNLAKATYEVRREDRDNW
jgi:TRAP-type C4-dicarboxylate transport system permease small subunit